MAKSILFLAVVLILSQQNEAKKTVPIINGDKLVLYCGEEQLNYPEIFETFQNTINNIKSILIDSCPPPNKGSYADVLRQLNVDYRTVRKLHLMNPPRLGPQSQHFFGLNLEELQILKGNAPAALTIDLKFLLGIPNLRKLTIDNCVIKGPFPNINILERVELSGGSFHGYIANCQGFKVLHLTDIKIYVKGDHDENHHKYLNNCTQLQELKLERMDSSTCANNILNALPKTVTNITVRNCELKDFPNSEWLYTGHFDHLSYDENVDDFILKHLDVSHNKIKDSVDFLATHRGLESLDISHNNLKNEIVFLPNLIEMKLDHNNFEKTCDDKYIYFGKDVTEWALKKFSAVGTGMRALCFDSMQNMSHLQLVNLTHNNIKVLDYRQLFNASFEYEVEVDLRYNPLERVNISQEDYESLKQNDPSVDYWRYIKLLTNARLPCDCSNAWFVRAVREELLEVEGATCDDGTSLEEPRPSYALQGCPDACEGDAGCSSAFTIHKMMNVNMFFIIVMIIISLY